MGFDAEITDQLLSRKNFLAGSLIAAFVPFQALAAQSSKDLTVEDIKNAEKLAGITLTDDQRKSTLGALKGSREGLDEIRKKGLLNEIPPAFTFVPHGKKPAPGARTSVKTIPLKKLKKPENDEDIAFLTVAELGTLIKSKQISCVQLTELYLARLKQFGPKLKCVITMTEDYARQRALELDTELKKGKYRGPLHGIPYGLKDLFAMKDYRTTWGAEPYKDQLITKNSTVVDKLEAAGAILVAKTSVGALAYGDLWFEGLTLNPWNSKQGASGSSAGSSSGMAAGLFGFAIGTETLGSIISPSHRCRVTGLRPTFGRVSRAGAMALSWTMDKAGPICRTAEDCALVFAAIHGADSRDPMSVTYPFNYTPITEWKKLKIGFVGKEIPGKTVELLRGLGANVTRAEFSSTPNGLDEVLSIEAAAAFDEIIRDSRVDTMTGSLWPPIFRSAAMLTGVDYVQAMRARSLLMAQFEEELKDYDLILAPERGDSLLVTTNLTGHPQLFVPLGLGESNRPIGVSLIGRLYREDTLLGVGSAIQNSAMAFRLRPDLSQLGSTA
jgi:Asp-tRNA(Asn)/Glu-tRNA(Gln) amidotransferase A subunit family amidase